MTKYDIRTEDFINATNYLKNELSIKLLDVAQVVGLERNQLDMVRSRRRKIKADEVNSLIEKYPEIERFFQKTPNQAESSIDYFERIISAKDEVIESQKAENARLRDDYSRLAIENKELRSDIRKLESKADKLLSKIMEQYNID